MKKMESVNMNGSMIQKILRMLRAETWRSYQGIIAILLLILAVLAILQFLWLSGFILMIASLGWIRADMLDQYGLLPKGDPFQASVIDQ